jgi:hypothetical protein
MVWGHRTYHGRPPELTLPPPHDEVSEPHRRTPALYSFDPSRLDLAREFRDKPFGAHSPDLQYLLNLMRTRETAGRYVLVMTRPHAQWTLARLTEGNKGPPRLTNTTFDSLVAAEWAVFKLRWEDLAGAPLELP